MNGPVSTVVIIDRGTWNSDISLIGHESPVEVTAFNPRVFRPTGTTQMNGDGSPPWISIIACAGQDRVLSIWNTSNPRPLVITQDIAEKSISDLCWSPEGMSLFISSYDGSVTVCIFEEGDLGKALPLEENVQYLSRYGHDRHGILLPESPAQLDLENRSREKEAESEEKDAVQPAQGVANDRPVIDSPQKSVVSTGSPNRPQYGSSSTCPSLVSIITNEGTTPQVLQKVTRTKDGKKRITPMFLGSSANAPITSSTPATNFLTAHSLASENTRSLDLSSPSALLPRGGMPTTLIGNKRKQLDDGAENDEMQVQSDKEIATVLRPAIINPATGVSQVRLGVPRVASHFEFSPAGESDLVLEARNGASQSIPSRITLSRGKSVVWVDYIPRAVVLMTGNDFGYAAACEDGSLITWTKQGRRLLPPLILEAQPCFLESQSHYLLCITSVGMVHIW